MLPAPSFPLQLARVVAALLTAAGILITGTLTTAWQVHQSEYQNAIQAARTAVSRTDQLLDEADKAALEARGYLSFPCSPDVRNELNRISIQQPHLRVISLLQDAKLTCSSFDTQTRLPRSVDLSQFTRHRLSLRPGSIITPGSPLLILLTVFPE